MRIDPQVYSGAQHPAERLSAHEESKRAAAISSAHRWRFGGIVLNTAQGKVECTDRFMTTTTPLTAQECAECARLLARCDDLAFEHTRISSILRLRLCQTRADLARLMKGEADELTVKSRNMRHAIERHIESAHA
jgi:hypothetical protein